MSKVYHTADWHLGHKNILKYRTGFADIQEHDKTLIDNYHALIKPRDTVYFQGDMCFDESYLLILAALPGRKHLILGNHDTEYLHIKDFVDIFDKIHGLKKYKDFWLSHAPLHPDELRERYNIHGHTHSRVLNDNRYYNICVDVSNYKPVDFEDIKAHYAI